MAPREHPAAKAGRYVRAAGIVLGREIDRRTATVATRPAPVSAPLLPPPPPVPTKDILGRTVFAMFALALVASAIMLAHADDLLPGTAKTAVRLALGAIMLLEAALLTSNWRRANERIGQRFLTRVFGIARGASNRRERAFARVVRDALTLAGIAFLAGGVYVLLVAAVGTG